MNSTEIITLVKAKLAEDLEKNGLSILDLEDALIKKADGDGMVTGAVKNTYDFLTNVVVPASLIGGTTLGGLTYAANKHIRDQDKALNDRRQEVDRYRQLTDRIKADYDLHV